MNKEKDSKKILKVLSKIPWDKIVKILIALKDIFFD
jgi:hypothetical protein